MSGQTVLPPNSVRSAYEDLLEAFRRAGEVGNCPVNLPALQSCFKRAAGNQTVDFAPSLYVKDWPCRQLPRRDRLHIVVKALEKLRHGDQWYVASSTVYVNYFVASGSGACLVQSLHFDFQEGGQPSHPYFHVHLNNESIPEPDLRSTGFDLQLELLAGRNLCFVTTRIPTAEMTLSSVLYCLVAGHLKLEIFKEFSETMRSIQDRLPALGFEALKGSLQESSRHFKSSHWFAHMRQ